ncbi:MAG: hypothetical protein K6T81_15785 [Alicyclobacillus macrosporangiidus]|nr:hypothetical protein [Alicyclobacillus macrosporangiidus]
MHVRLPPEMGSLLFLRMAVGMYKAKEVWYMGKEISASEAERYGLVHRLIAPG